MSFDITTIHHFSAAHQLRLYDGSLEPIHGHNWKVAVTVSAEKLDSIGVVMDFHELERLVNQIIAPLHNTHLNNLDAFKAINPSTENVCVLVAEKLKLPANVWLRTIQVWETDTCSAIYRPK